MNSEFGYNYLSAPMSTDDTYLIDKRESIRNKNGYYKHYEENRIKSLEIIEKLNVISNIKELKEKKIDYEKIRNQSINGCELFFK